MMRRKRELEKRGAGVSDRSIPERKGCLHSDGEDESDRPGLVGPPFEALSLAVLADQPDTDDVEEREDLRRVAGQVDEELERVAEGEGCRGCQYSSQKKEGAEKRADR